MILRNLNIERQERPEDNVHLENLNVREDEIQGNDIPEDERIRVNENEEI